MSKHLWIAACVHLGAKGHDRTLFNKYLTRAKREGWDIAIIGDLMDMGLPCGTKHIGSVWDNDLNPEEQIDEAVELLRPVRKQIKSISIGNHELRAQRLTSMSPLKAVADRLRAPYHGPNHILRWNGLNVFLAHGVSGGLTADMNKVMLAYEGLDVIALGHVHHMMDTTVRRLVVNAKAEVDQRIVHMVRCGNFLKDAPYAKLALHPPTDTGSVILEKGKEGLKVYVGLVR